jgi:hypothetical protein
MCGCRASVLMFSFSGSDCLMASSNETMRLERKLQKSRERFRTNFVTPLAEGLRCISFLIKI